MPLNTVVPARPLAATLLTILALVLTGLTTSTSASAARSAALPTSPSFDIATFNVLGSQHTLGSSRWASGRVRAKITADVIEREGIDVVGLQEVQADQLEVLTEELGGYAVWPGTSLGGGGMRLQIAWKRWLFDLVDQGSITTAFDRQLRPVPWVLLEHRATGRKMYVVDVHNSARDLETERDSATRQEVALVRQLRATRRSVFVVGDMNEHTEAFCKFVGRTDLVAPNGGSAASARDCTPPPGRLYIDWIFGAGPMTFSRYAPLADDLVSQASDHSLIKARVTLRPRNR